MTDSERFIFISHIIGIVNHSVRNTRQTPSGGKASERLRSALAQGGSPAPQGKRSVFPERQAHEHIITLS